MIHQPLGGFQGQASDFDIHAKEILKARERLNQILVTHTGQPIEKVEAELARLDRIGGVESIIPTEGLVFVYKGKTFKLTGTFAAINQLMGIIKYGR